MNQNTEIVWKPNPHLWRKMKQAERNMMLGWRRKRRNWPRTRRWGRIFKSTLDKIITQ